MRLGGLLTALPAIVLFLVHFFGQANVFIDDAFIFYRYADNWASGLGPIYNLGERVEGYSSLLWTAVLALGARLGVAPTTLGPALGLVLGVAAVWLTGRLADRLFPDRPIRFAIPLALSLSSGFAYYAAAGMDTPIFAVCVLASVLAADSAFRDGRVRGLAFALAILVAARAEGFLYAMVAVIAVAAVARRGGTALGRRGVVVTALVTSGAMALQFGWRHWFYGEWLPATMIAKSYSSHLLHELSPLRPATWRPLLHALARGVRYEAFAIPALVPPLVALAVRGRRMGMERGLVWTMVAFVALSVTVTIWAVGDWMPYHRHVVPVWGVAMALFAWSLIEITRALRAGAIGRWSGVIAFGGLLAVGLHTWERPLASPGSAFREEKSSLYMRQVGTTLAELDTPVVVLTNVAGKVSYYAGARTYVRDLLGLTDLYNSKHGALWVATYGRTDLHHSFVESWDVLVTNTTGDLLNLLESTAHDPRAADLVLFPNSDWLGDRFFVVAHAGAPVTRALSRLCGCDPVPVDAALVAALRARELAPPTP